MANKFLNGIDTTSLSVNSQYSLPTSDGSNKQVLTTDGNGNVTFSDVDLVGAQAHYVYYEVKNSTGATIPKGTAVRAVGTDGNSGHILVSAMVADGSVEPKYFIGITSDAIGNGQTGEVIHFGMLTGFDTSGFTDGDVLFCDPANDGDFTTTEPAGPNLKLAVAFVVSAAINGKIFIRVQGNEGLHELHDVNISSQANGDLLQWNATSGVWENKTLASIADSRYVNVSGDTMTGDLILDANRKVTIDPDLGQVNITPSAGGWSTGYFFNNSSGTYVGGFGLLGNADALTYFWIGDNYNDASLTIKPSQGDVNIVSGQLQMGGTSIIDSSRNIVNAGTGAFAGNVTVDGLLRVDGSLHIDTATGTQRLEISRSGSSDSQVVKIGVADTTTDFVYIEDTTSEGSGNFGAYRFILGGNDGESNIIPLRIDKEGIDVNGAITADSFVKNSGTSSQFLKADGSVDSSTYLTSESDTLETVTSRGSTTAAVLYLGSDSATDGALAISDRYTGDDHLANIGFLYSSGGVYLGYGVKQDGSADWKSTFDNFEGERSFVKLDEDSFVMAWSNAQNTAVGTAVTMAERFRFDLQTGKVSVGGGHTPNHMLHIRSDGTSSNRGIRIESTATNGFSEIVFDANPEEFRIGVGGSDTATSYNNKFYFYNLTNGKIAHIDAVGNMFMGNEISTGYLRVRSTSDASLTSTGHGIQVGDTAAENIIIDNNEIMARNNGAAGTLYLQHSGGLTHISDTLQVDSTANFDGNVTLSSGNRLIFDKTNTASGGDFNFIELGYNGSWSDNVNGLAAIEVNDGTGSLGKFGITYNGSKGVFTVTNLYNAATYGASGDVFTVAGDGNATISNNLTVNNVYTDNTVYFDRSGSGNYENFIRSQNYPSEGYTSATGKYWLEYNTKGGHHFVVNSDGGAGDVENDMDDFTIWQGAVDGDRLFSVSNVGNTFIAGNTGFKNTNPTYAVDISNGSSSFMTTMGSGRFFTNQYTMDLSLAATGGWARGFRVYNSNDNTYSLGFGKNDAYAYYVVDDPDVVDVTLYNSSKGIRVYNNGDFWVGKNALIQQSLRAGSTYDGTPNGTTFSHTLADTGGSGRVVNFDGNGDRPSVWWSNGDNAVGAIDGLNGTNGLTFWVNSSGGSWQRNFYIDTDYTEFERKTVFDSTVSIGTTDSTFGLNVNTDSYFYGDTYIENYKAALIGVATTPVNSAGWYKIGKIDSRGGGIIHLSFTGGNYTPVTYEIKYYKNWSAVTTLKLEQYGSSQWITAARIRFDSSDSKYYIEVYCISNGNGLQFDVYHTKMLGYNASGTVYTGALSAGSVSGTTYSELNFQPFGTTVQVMRSEGDLYGYDDAYLSVNSGHITIVGGIHNSTSIGSDTKLILRGKNVSSSGSYYGSYGQLLFDANTNYTGSALKYLLTNAYKVNKFAIIRGNTGPATPFIGESGAVENGSAALVISETGNTGINGDPEERFHVHGGRLRVDGGEVLVNTSVTGVGWLTVKPSSNIYDQIAINVIAESGGSYGGTYANIRGDGTYYGTYSTFGNYTTSGDGVQFYDAYQDGDSAYYHRPKILAGTNDGSTGGVDEADVGLLVHNTNGANNTWAKIALGGREAAGAGNTVSWAGIAAKKVSGTSGSWARGNLVFWTKNNSITTTAGEYQYNGNYDGYYLHYFNAGAQIRQGLNLMRSVNNKSGISFYNDTYYNWQIYMASATDANCGANGNLTAPSGLSSVTSWALRSRMEGVSTYGWLWETGGSGGGGATASPKMELGATTGTLRVTGDVIAYASDERLKTNVKPIENAVEKVKQISGVTYDWVDNIEDEYDFHPNSKHEAGVLAQEIEKVLPEAVMTAPMNAPYTAKTGVDHEFKTVKYERIVPLLIEAIKDQQKQIDELKAMINGDAS